VSRIGNKEIILEDEVSVEVQGQNITVKGKKGELSLKISSDINIIKKENVINLERTSEKKEVKAKHGLYRSLLSNMVHGVSKGYEKKLKLEGIGYRVSKKGENLEFLLGYSHPVQFEIPKGLQANVEGQDKITVTGIDKQLIGETCAKMKKLRRRDAYKGKGIHFETDIIRKKPGKSIKK